MKAFLRRSRALHPYVQAATAFRTQLRAARRASGRAKIEKVADVTAKLRRVYFYTSEKGVYRIDSSGVYRILEIPCYGIAINGDWVYLALFDGGYSTVVRCDRKTLTESDARPDFREIYRIPARSSNERIHQIYLGDEALWVTNTGRNTVLEIDPNDCVVQAEIPLILDRFDHPVMFDTNHINSVFRHDGVMLFTAYRAGDQSMIGIYDGESVTGYGYRNVGIHDIFLTEDGLYFCDTFGTGDPDTGGAVITPDGPLDPAFFQQPPGYIVRGLAGTQDEFLVGHSFKGTRAKRFDGRGAILVCRNKTIQGKIDVPTAQVYQIITSDGDFLMPRPAKLDLEKLHDELARTLGEPIYHAKPRPL